MDKSNERLLELICEKNRNDFITELQEKLRKDLINEIEDMEIRDAAIRCCLATVSYMIRTGEVKEKIDNQEVDLPLPEGDRYTAVLIDITDRIMKHPTWSLLYAAGSKAIMRDKRIKVDGWGLTLNDYAIIFYYAKHCYEESAKDFAEGPAEKSVNKSIYYPQDTEKEQMTAFINRHDLDTTYDSFKNLVAKYLRPKDRYDSGLIVKVYPYVEQWYYFAVPEIWSEIESLSKNT